ALFPRKLRRASVYAAGTPMTSASSTTANTTSTVTHSTESSWNSFHAAVYQLVVQPSGNHVPSQRLAKELVATAAIIKATLTTNSVIVPRSRPRHARSSQARPPGFIPCLPRQARDKRDFVVRAPPRQSTTARSP